MEGTRKELDLLGIKEGEGAREELSTIIGKLDDLLDKGRINAQAVNIIQKQKLVLKEQVKSLQDKLDELQEINRINEKVIERQARELSEIKEDMRRGIIKAPVW